MDLVYDKISTARIFKCSLLHYLTSRGDRCENIYEEVAVRLFSSLQVDSSKARDLLGWKPVITMDEQLKKIADLVLNKKEA